jgi:hypothetical protein
MQVEIHREKNTIDYHELLFKANGNIVSHINITFLLK